MKSLQGKVTLITGAGRGIGKAIAQAFAKAGSDVMLTARTKNELAQLAVELEKEGVKVHYHPTDVSNKKDVDGLVTEMIKLFGKCDIVVNNAGVGIFKPVYELTDEDWQTVIGTNLTGVFYVTRAVLPYMREKKSGYIINISSLAGQNPFAGAAAYCASKFGLNGFTECLMQDVRQDNIKVSCICPGSVNTDFGRSAKTDNSWKIDPADIGQLCIDLVSLSTVSLASKIELRPLKPPKKG